MDAGGEAFAPVREEVAVFKILSTFVVISIALVLCCRAALAQTSRWSEQKANDWYSQQPWLVGSNYVPKSAVNELEMWQETTFDPAQIDKELGWAEAIGMNTMRVFLHDLLWEQDDSGFRKRIDQFLGIASRHHIRTLFVLFDSCWDPLPRLGPQQAPTPGVHNSGWVQSPGAKALDDPRQYPRLKRYVQGVVGAFANDNRVLGWDLWNEPGCYGAGRHSESDLTASDKIARVTLLLPQVFQWAREMAPSQPVTGGVWQIDASVSRGDIGELQRIQLQMSDVITFHNYGWPESFERELAWLRRFNRPVICTEFMARAVGSTIDAILPIAKQERVGVMSWGFVAGKTQTYLPWESWQHPYVRSQPPVWFHDLLHPDGTPYRQAEVDLIRELAGAR